MDAKHYKTAIVLKVVKYIASRTSGVAFKTLYPRLYRFLPFNLFLTTD